MERRLIDRLVIILPDREVLEIEIERVVDYLSIMWLARHGQLRALGALLINMRLMV